MSKKKLAAWATRAVLIAFTAPWWLLGQACGLLLRLSGGQDAGPVYTGQPPTVFRSLDERRDC